MKLKKDKKSEVEVKEKKKKVKVKRVGRKRAPVIFLWLLFIGGLAFAIYKDFTAIDVHTVHEKEIVQQRVVDTNGLENFIINFAKVYYTWSPDKVEQEARLEEVNQFLTSDLQSLNLEMIPTDVKTTSKVSSVQIWSVEELEDSIYNVVFTVSQGITLENETKDVTGTYAARVFMDDTNAMVIVQNPTISSVSGVAEYESKVQEADGTVDADTMDEVTEFLESFFTLYPTATEKELTYYIQDHVLSSIQREYKFVELLNPVMTMEDDQVHVSLAVEYLDADTGISQISQFNLVLAKMDNWKIVDVR